MISTAFANEVLSSLDSPAIQLHVGEPGPNGRANPAVGVDRRTVKFTKPVRGRVENAEPVVWLNVSAMETYTNFTAWDGDLFLFGGAVMCNTVYAGDNVIVGPGELTASFNVGPA